MKAICEIGVKSRTGLNGSRLIERRVGGVRRARRQDQRVAVRFRPRDVFGGDVAAGAGAIVHDDGLAQPLTQRLGHQPRRDIGAAARREGHDDAEGLVRRPARLGLRGSAGRTGQGRKKSTFQTTIAYDSRCPRRGGTPR